MSTNPVKIDMLIFLDVFKNNLWLGVAGMVALLSICLYVIARLMIGRKQLHDDQHSESFGLLNSIALVMLVYMQRDYSVYKKGLSTRCRGIVYLKAGLICFKSPIHHLQN